MQVSTQTAKSRLRLEVLAHVKDLGRETRATGAVSARLRLAAQSRWREARRVLFFAPTPRELDIWPLLEEALAGGKLVGLPRFVAGEDRYEACAVQGPGDVLPGHFGIREPRRGLPPLALNLLDFILVPGVAFDLHGHRLGRGKGYYDRLLKQTRGTTCGVAFDEQIVGEIPVEPHDLKVNCILTPTRWIEV